MQTWDIVQSVGAVWLFGGETQSPGLLVQALTPRHHTEKLDFNP